KKPVVALSVSSREATSRCCRGMRSSRCTCWCTCDACSSGHQRVPRVPALRTLRTLRTMRTLRTRTCRLCRCLPTLTLTRGTRSSPICELTVWTATALLWVYVRSYATSK
ncbi:MAG: hypothetical protein MHM6MM_006053, partial [Cercozoa sp. M6MM]